MGGGVRGRYHAGVVGRHKLPRGEGRGHTGTPGNTDSEARGHRRSWEGSREPARPDCARLSHAVVPGSL